MSGRGYYGDPLYSDEITHKKRKRRQLSGELSYVTTVLG